MELTPGSRYRSTVCDGQVVVVRGAAGDVDLRFGGRPVVPADIPAEPAEARPDLVGEIPMGKRYADAETGIEVLVTKAAGSLLSVGDRLLEQKSAKALPASD